MAEVRVINVGDTYENDVSIKSHWWKQPDDEVYQSVVAVVEGIEMYQQNRSLNNLRFARLYSNTELPGLSAYQYTKMVDNGLLRNRVTLNVIKSCIDTVSAQIASTKPRPMFLTNGGDWTQQKRAEKLTQYLDGVFDEAKIYNVGRRCFVDAAVFGTGFMKIYTDDHKICVERVFPDEIIVDDAEGIYEQPQQLHQRRLVARSVLKDMFPEHTDKIEVATAGRANTETTQNAADLVMVIESWHLPSGKDAGDGKHTICLDNCTLFAEPWTKMYFPFAVIRWTPRLVGFYGQGLAEELVGLQLEINKILLTIQRSQHLMSVPRIFVDVATNVNTAHINNEVGAIIKYSGQPPIMSTAQAQSPEMYQHLERLYAKAYEITGISQMSAQAKRPEGIEAGVALRTLRDIQSERFLLTAQAYEQFYMDAAEIIVDMSFDMKRSTVKVVNRKKKTIEDIKWADVKMDRDSFKMQLFPTNILPTTPAGRLQTVQDLMQGGFIQPDQALDLLDFPDLQQYFSLRTAAVDDIKMQIELMLEDGEYQAPEKYQNLQLALEMVQSAYLRAKTNKVSEDRLELLRTYMEDVVTLLGQNEVIEPTQDVNLTQAPVTPSVSVIPEQPTQPPIEGAAPVVPPEMAPVV